jgi:hypothetical protein
LNINKEVRDMLFTVAVQAEKTSSKNINVRNLKLFHKECFGGSIEICTSTSGVEHDTKEELVLTCTRCDAVTFVPLSGDNPLEIIRVALCGTTYKVISGLYETTFVRKEDTKKKK